MSAPRTDLPLNRDEWPNLSSIDGRARFADGELATPLEIKATSTVPMGKLVVAVLGLCAATIYFFTVMAR